MIGSTKAKQKEQFVVRLPDGMRDKIALAAKENNRSMNAEIVARLEMTFVAPTISRLKWLLETMERVLGNSKFSLSRLAEAIGEETPYRLERVFSGAEEPTFRLLDSIAEYCAVNSDWLKHGDSVPFKVCVEGTYDEDFLEFLVSDKPKTIHVIRADSEKGEVCVVKQYDDHVCTTIRTYIHLSDHVGATGQRHQVELANTSKKLYRYSGIYSRGCMMPDEQFSKLIAGTIHPLLALNDARYSTWFDDWWDPQMIAKVTRENEPWKGYRKLVERVFEESKAAGHIKA
ncbi:Arc family DNA-binding protein [Pseudovibrio exalbescens]|uniref:Arc-like DNA binding domain-containing protein n=1 Tax=Pseudovibrio exalbescens TaxID=197461 RepID=A0A1U7JLC5_9HYPH|nr:Arc family DNA-binding protein [Pseudovibrio exalbescens]OKL45451.1 hypothetical protein A3843_03780 [Pseudovibrio exalbescens]